MPAIMKPAEAPLDPTGNINMPAMELPSFRRLLADERGLTRNILIQTPFALGDCVCAEPAIRYATENFKGCAISIVTGFPFLYRHLKAVKVYDSKDGWPDWDKYWVLKCYYDSEELQSEFTQNFNMQIGDYIATCLFKGQIPIENRNIRLPTPFRNEEMPKSKVVIHAGKHWKTKTFPKHWWDKIVKGLVANKIQPALIGATVDKGKRGYVELESDGCLDYRDKLSVMQSVSLLRQADVVITNDSAPFHMAASGDAWIGYFSTVRHHDFTSHWRPNENGVNQWSYKIEDLALGTMWKDNDINPVTNGVKYDDIDTPTLISWLPEPEDVVDWAMEKLGSH